MVETRRGKRKDNPTKREEKKTNCGSTKSGARTKRMKVKKTTTENNDTTAAELTEKTTTEVMEPINVVVAGSPPAPPATPAIATNSGDEEQEEEASEEEQEESDEHNVDEDEEEQEEADGEGEKKANDEEEEEDVSGEKDGSDERDGSDGSGEEEISNEGIRNENPSALEGGEESDGTEATEAIKPMGMFFKPCEYKKKIKLGTRCLIVDAMETLSNLKPKLSNAEWNWFADHPQFKHIFHMKRENHRVQGMWMLLLRTTHSSKEREVWFVVNGIPIRYGLREHALISGLNCQNYPLGYKECGGTKFVDRHFKEGEFRRLEDVKAKLVNMGPNRDRLKMAVLFFLASVICAQTKVGNWANDVLELFQRAVDDLDFCRTFPWGRYSFDYMLKEISHTMDHFGGVVKENTLWPLPGFCVPLELLAFEAIPKLGKQFRVPVEGADVYCPRMCHSSFKRNGMKGVSLSVIYKALGEDTDIYSIIPTKTPQEETLLDDIMEDEDDVDKPDLSVDSWDKRLDEGLTIFFKDMYDEDVAARETQADEIEDAAADGVQLAGQLSQPRDVMKMLKTMMKLIKKVDKKVDQLDGRLAPLEAFVKDVEKQKQKKK